MEEEENNLKHTKATQKNQSVINASFRDAPSIGNKDNQQNEYDLSTDVQDFNLCQRMKKLKIDRNIHSPRPFKKGAPTPLEE